MFKKTLEILPIQLSGQHFTVKCEKTRNTLTCLKHKSQIHPVTGVAHF